MIAVVLVTVGIMLDGDIGRAKRKPPLRSILSKSSAINRLSAARFFLFGSRDIWFVVALPIFLDEVLGWSYEGIGAFLAAWVIGYGIVQSFAPRRPAALARDRRRRGRRRAPVGVRARNRLRGARHRRRTRRRRDRRRGRGPDRVRRGVRRELVAPLVPVLAYSQGDDVSARRRLLLLGERRRDASSARCCRACCTCGAGSRPRCGAAAAFVAVTWLLTLRLPPVAAQIDHPVLPAPTSSP